MITKAQALGLTYRTVIYHGTERNADGTPLSARVNGAVKTWKTRPDEFRVPMKYGLKTCFYLDETNSEDWFLDENDA